LYFFKIRVLLIAVRKYTEVVACAARDYVNMQVKNTLFSAHAVRVDYVHTVKKTFLRVVFCDLLDSPKHRFNRFGVCVQKVCAVFFGYNKRMPHKVVRDIQKCEGFFVLVDFVAWDFAVYDFTKYAVFHFSFSP
jgi:hypothetical protein